MKKLSSSSKMIPCVLALPCILAFLFILACSHETNTREQKIESAPSLLTESELSPWIEYGPKGQWIARVLVSPHDSCPNITIDGVDFPMKVHADRDAKGDFPQKVCELASSIKPRVGASTSPLNGTFSGTYIAASIAGKPLPQVRLLPKKIIIIGDTGCRLLENPNGRGVVQECNKPEKWQFARIVKQAAALNPDLVIHVGDYHYRESDCPSIDLNKCQGSPSGDRWLSWNADFFTPAQPLLKKAPWIFARGNHEACGRAHIGFFRFFDPQPVYDNLKCQETTAPYLVTFQNFSAVILDSSKKDIDSAAWKSLRKLSLNKSWLITHRPPWNPNIVIADPDEDRIEVESKNPPHVPVGVPRKISLVLSGHRHLFQAESFFDRRPPQIIAGNGGTLLEPHPYPEASGTPIDGNSTKIRSIKRVLDFGFTLLEQQNDGKWKLTDYDMTGNARASCQWDEKHKGDLNCD